MYFQQRKGNESGTESDKRILSFALKEAEIKAQIGQLYMAAKMANGKFKIYVNMKENAPLGPVLPIIDVPRIE